MAEGKKGGFFKPAELVITNGRLGQDPELRYTGTGTAICKFSVCVNTRTKKDDPKNKAIWFNFIAFHGLAEHIASNYRKGGKISIAEATPDQEQWTGKDGKDYKKDVWMCWKITEDVAGEAPSAPDDEPPMPGNPDDDDIPF